MRQMTPEGDFSWPSNFFHLWTNLVCYFFLRLCFFFCYFTDFFLFVFILFLLTLFSFLLLISLSIYSTCYNSKNLSYSISTPFFRLFVLFSYSTCPFLFLPLPPLYTPPAPPTHVNTVDACSLRHRGIQTADHNHKYEIRTRTLILELSTKWRYNKEAN